MFEKLFSEIDGQAAEEQPDVVSGYDVRVCTITLLIHVAMIDHHLASEEIEHMLKRLTLWFGCSGYEAGHLFEVGQFLLKQPGKVEEYTAIIAEQAPVDEKVRFLARVWGIIQADGIATFEELTEAKTLRERLGLSLEQAVLARKLSEGD